MKIEILEAKIKTETIPAKDGGKGWTFYRQQAYVYLPDEDGVLPKYPTEFTISHEKATDTPYAPGFYTIADVSFRVGEYKRLEIFRVKLVKAPVAQARAA